FRNTSTDYTSGNEFHLDALLGYHLDKQWKVGLNAFYYKQLTDDTVGSGYAGPPINNGNRGQLFGIGPAIGYEYNHIHFALKYQKEMAAQNKFEGDRFWFKVAIPF
ncbi:MAG: transporter, partial [Syntrophales bacterium LBB04]|nr:transporter [Syntrophales bacterium LBB04]